MTEHAHPAQHFTDRIPWLRAAVLGANDGIVSTASLVIGVAAASSTRDSILIAGIAGMVAGTMSMAAGEYVSVSSQADSEHADLARERRELEHDEDAERHELAQIYIGRGLEPKLAQEVAKQLHAHDALAAHARDELGISETHRARPIQAAGASGLAFAAGALLPLALVAIAPMAQLIPITATTAIVFLAALGALGARVGGADMLRGARRVAFWSALAMGLTAAVGVLCGEVL